jgi:hypothetical protein
VARRSRHEPAATAELFRALTSPAVERPHSYGPRTAHRLTFASPHRRSLTAAVYVTHPITAIGTSATAKRTWRVNGTPLCSTWLVTRRRLPATDRLSNTHRRNRRQRPGWPCTLSPTFDLHASLI